MNLRTRIWHWAFCKSVDYEYGMNGRVKSERLARRWTRINDGICDILDRIGWGKV